MPPEPPQIEITRRNGHHPTRGALRIALYSHDAQGLGHIRRNLLISRALTRDGASPVILLLSGVREASSFAMPAGVDCLTLPALGKGIDGTYFPRSLQMPLDELVGVRQSTIHAALQSFEPDVLIVDKLPSGVFNELRPTLEMLRKAERTRLVLGLRDILDSAESVRAEWSQNDFETTVRRLYDAIWVYGDQSVFDLGREYDLPKDLREKIRYSGYLNPCHEKELTTDARAPTPPAWPRIDRTGPRTLCVVGGGRDGVPLATSFLNAELPGPGMLVTGPLMATDDRHRLEHLAAARPDIELREFVTDPCPLIRSADQIISMGGYNTVCESLCFSKPTLIVPRVKPRTEQLIRARRLAELGLLDMLHPDDLSGPALSDWAMEPHDAPTLYPAIDFDGVFHLRSLLDDLLQTGPPLEERIHHAR